MEAFGRLIRLLRHRGFRRLVLVRVCSQSGDATVQVGLAAHILFSPQSQPDAWSIAAVIALVMVPFSVVGPFVSPVLDRFSRRNTAVVCDGLRAVLAVATMLMVASGRTGGGGQVALYTLLLVILGLNRLQLASLGAGMLFTVDADEYVEAASVMPMIGPLAAIGGGLVAAVVRLSSGQSTPIFGIAAAGFAAAVVLTLGFGRRQLGPRADQPRAQWSQVWSGLSAGIGGLWAARPAFVGVLLVFGARIGYGALMTMIIVLYRHLGAGDDPDSVLVAMGIWFLASGAGFALSGLVATPAVALLGVRRTLIAAFGVAGLAQLAGAGLTVPLLVGSGFVLGLCLQSVKICGDTLVQAQVADQVRGRVMIIYDIINNLGYAVGAVLAAAVLPASGRSVPVAIGLAVFLLLVATGFALVSRRDAAAYDLGTVHAPDTTRDA